MSFDTDLDFLQDDELRDLARLLQSRRLPEPPLDPAFRSSLRRDLRRRHWEMLETSLPWWRRLTSGPALAWTAATVGAAMIAAATLFLIHPPPPSTATVVTSPLDHMTNVAVLQPMQLTFQTSMDHQSVEQALQIVPATQVTYQWRGNTLLVQPMAGQLAPNTQYRLTLGSTATTSAGAQLGKPATIVFVTSPQPPSSAPTPTPTPQPVSVALGHRVDVTPASAVTPAWSPDSSTLFYADPLGSLHSVPAAGGTPFDLGVQGVRSIAVGPDGSQLAVQTSAGMLVVLKPDGSGARDYEVPDALALGWRNGKLYAATSAAVVEVKQPLDRLHPVAALAVGAQQAAFSPDGSRLIYLDTIGKVHLLDVGGGQDTAWQTAAATLPVWSADGAHVAFLGDQGLMSAGPDGTGAGTLASLQQLGVAGTSGTSIAWSGTSLLVGAANVLSGVDLNLHDPAQLVQDGVAGLSAAPNRTSLAYVEKGRLRTAAVSRPGVSPQLEKQAAGLLTAFMTARQGGDAAGAAKYLDAAGQQAYAKGTLLFAGSPKLARWFNVFEQARPDGTVTTLLRLVLTDSKGLEVQQLDEVLGLTAGPSGALLIDGVQQTPARAVDAGPEIVGITAGQGQVQVTFDSDLRPDTAGAVALLNASGVAVGGAPTYSNRTVTLTFGSASPGDVLQLSIPQSVRDVGGRTVMQAITIQVAVPEAEDSAVSPSPSPSPSP